MRGTNVEGIGRAAHRAQEQAGSRTQERSASAFHTAVRCALPEQANIAGLCARSAGDWRAVEKLRARACFVTYRQCHPPFYRALRLENSPRLDLRIRSASGDRGRGATILLNRSRFQSFGFLLDLGDPVLRRPIVPPRIQLYDNM